MKNLVMFALLLAPFASARAAVLPVKVQCHAEGPVHDGTLEIEPDMSQWRPAGCRRSAPGGSYGSVYVPRFRLSFNGLDYFSSGYESVGAWYSLQDCQGTPYAFDNSGGITLSEASTRYPVRAQLYASSAGATVEALTLKGDEAICYVKRQ